MNLTSLVITFHILIVIYLEVGIMAKPTNRQQQKRNKNSSKHGHNADSKKEARSGRKLRMLHKILKGLTPEDVWQLTRTKKDRKFYEEYEQYMTSQILSINTAQQPSSSSNVQVSFFVDLFGVFVCSASRHVIRVQSPVLAKVTVGWKCWAEFLQTTASHH